MSFFNQQPKYTKGFTLIEVMIALVILAAGLLSLISLQIVSIRGNAFSSEMTYASMLAQGRLEQIRNTMYDSVIPGTVTDTVPASELTKGTAYTVETTVDDDIPDTDMKTITVKIDWTGTPAGSENQQTVNFTTSFITVIAK